MTTDRQDFDVWDLPRRMGLEADIAALQQVLRDWVEQCDSEVREMVRRQFSGRAKYYRPVAVFACHRAMTGEPPPAPEWQQRRATVQSLYQRPHRLSQHVRPQSQVSEGDRARRGRGDRLIRGSADELRCLSVEG